MDRAAHCMHLAQVLRSVALEMEVSRDDFARQQGIHPTDLRALTLLLDAARTGTEATPSWLARRLGMPSAATTAVIDRLEGAGLVERQRDSPDRRRVRLAVTGAAVDLGWSYFGPLIEHLVEGMARFSQGELAVATRVLASLTADG